ncbi:hypothetical protein GW17_00059541 [Ensete ventricosum]|nr:hypothetical protein GW17_00059541 [Ensete ventricosum]
MLRMEVLAIGVCCSATFPRGSERCSGEDHGTSSVGRCGVGGYPREGDASCCATWGGSHCGDANCCIN